MNQTQSFDGDSTDYLFLAFSFWDDLDGINLSSNNLHKHVRQPLFWTFLDMKGGKTENQQNVVSYSLHKYRQWWHINSII